MQKVFLSAMLIGALGLSGGIATATPADTPESIAGTQRVNAEELIELVQTMDNLVIIDARTKADYQNGHIEGAVGLTDTDTSPEALAKIIPAKDVPVLFYCNGVKCGRSVKSCEIAVSAGYTKIYWFRGGWEEWSKKGYPVAY